MPQPPTLRITEIFFSAAGEGCRQGEPTIFIRLAGCNLRCSFCDTKYAWKDGREMSVEKIASAVEKIKQKFPAVWVCLTGGEPLLQELKPLVRKLKQSGFRIQIETNGTQDVVFRPDWLTVSPKPPDYLATESCRKMADEVKLVVTRELSFKEIKKVREAFPDKAPVFLQPQSAAVWSYRKAWKLYLEAVHEGIPGLKLSCQLHKIYGIK